MSYFPIQYNEPVFRPPSEWKSLIIQVTLGCSWNKCAFCEMYTSKEFRARKEKDVFADIDAFIPQASLIRRVFLADGDPLVLPTRRLLGILNHLRGTFPRLQRVSAYASPNNLIRKSLAELQELRDAGLNLIFVGLESGDNEVLHMINKGETAQSMIEGINKSKQAGLESSVMIINGVGGRRFSEQHGLNSAILLNEIQPKYLSTLVLTAYKGMDYLKSRLNTDFIELNQKEQIQEMKVFLEHLQLQETIFRSDHASNHMVLKGVLGRDKEKFLNQIEQLLKM